MKRLISLAVVCLLAASGLFASNVLVYGYMKEHISKDIIHQFDIHLTVDGEQQEVMRFTNGKYEFTLEYDHIYTVRYSAENCVSKTVQIDTFNIPSGEQAEAGYGMQIDIEMIDPQKAGVSRKALQFLEKELIAKAVYNPNSDKVDWDMEYTKGMMDQLKKVLN